MHAAMVGVVLPLAIGGFEPSSVDAPLAVTFESPVRCKAGDELLGADRLFPSPVFHDVDGDGLLDVVVGDLLGRLTVALQRKVGDARTYAPETEVLAADGKPVDFHNW